MARPKSNGFSIGFEATHRLALRDLEADFGPEPSLVHLVVYAAKEEYKAA